jgi:hypothetical protein
MDAMSTLMMEAEAVFETLYCNSVFTRLVIAWGDLLRVNIHRAFIGVILDFMRLFGSKGCRVGL